MKRIYLLLLLLCTALNLKAQDLDLKWSSRATYSNFKDGFFDEFVGASDEHVYGMYNDMETRFFRWNRNKFDITLAAFDKDNMQQVYTTKLRTKKDKARRKKMKGYTYLETIVQNETVMVFWKKSTLTQSDIYAESFDTYLNRKTKLTRIYSVKHSTNKKGKKKRRKRNLVGNLAGVPIVVQGAKDGSNNIMICTEIQKGKNEPVEFDYKILDAEFAEVNKGHIKLPLVQVSKYMTGSVFSYEYGKDGNIYIKCFVRLSKEEEKQAAKGEYRAYSMLSVVSPATAEIESYTMKYDGMNVFNFNFLTDESGVKLYGFFNDLSKDATGRRTHGIFYATIKDNEISEPVFSYFDKEMLADLFKEDPNEKKPISKKKRMRKMERALDDEALDESYEIEAAKAIDNENIVLFCSKVYNYTTVTCTSSGAGGGTTCVVNYYCRKRNITAFKLDNEGEIVWASNVDREKTFSGWNVRDMRIIHDKEKFYVIYGSDYHTDKKRRSGKRAKKRKEVRDEFEYAIFDYETGKNEKQEYVVNPKATERKERKYMNPLAIQEFDNQLFVNSTRMKVRPLYFAAATVATFGPGLVEALALPFIFAPPLALLWWPIIFVPINNGYMYKGAGHMGTIELPKNNEDKKK